MLRKASTRSTPITHVYGASPRLGKHETEPALSVARRGARRAMGTPQPNFSDGTHAGPGPAARPDDVYARPGIMVESAPMTSELGVRHGSGNRCAETVPSPMVDHDEVATCVSLQQISKCRGHGFRFQEDPPKLANNLR